MRKYKLLKKNGIVILHRHKNGQNFEGLNIIDRKIWSFEIFFFINQIKSLLVSFLLTLLKVD